METNFACEIVDLNSFDTFTKIDKTFEKSSFDGVQQLRRILYSFFIFKSENVDLEIKICKKGESIKSILINVIKTNKKKKKNSLK